jgi:hypothetical protein
MMMIGAIRRNKKIGLRKIERRASEGWQVEGHERQER